MAAPNFKRIVFTVNFFMNYLTILLYSSDSSSSMVTENSKKLCFKVILYYIPKLYNVSFSIGSPE